jgi:8-oxo-dGTP diphosphatase
MSRYRSPLLVSAALIVKDGRVLIGQRRKGDRHSLKWEFPGGKVENGETPQQGLARELREELCIDASIGAEIARYQHDYPGGTSVLLLFYAVKAFVGEPACLVFEQIEWAPLDSLPKYDFLDGDVDFVRRIARGEFKAMLG